MINVFEGASEKYGDWLIPLILVLLIGGILAIKVFNMYWIPVLGPMLTTHGLTRVLILTNPTDYEAANNFAAELRSVFPNMATVVDNDLAEHVRKGYITSNHYDLVVIYGDHTKMTPAARTEIASFVSSGGNLLIFKGAGLKDTEDPYVFTWQVGDLAPIISFAPDCTNIDNCNSTSQITVTASEIGNKISFIPVQWENPIIKRSGITSTMELDVPANFTLVKVQDLGNNKLAYLEWKDTNGDVHSVPAIIAYQSGISGRVMYMAYNPLDLKQVALFRNAILWLTGKI